MSDAPGHPPVSDDAVSRLPLSAGRAELLEEIIMSTPVLDRTTRADAVPRRRRWTVPVAAAAAVVVVAGGGVAATRWLADPVVVATPATAPAPDGTQRVLLEAAGWVPKHVDAGGGASWAKGSADLEVTVYPAASYDAYVADREHIVDPPAPGAPVEVLGAPGQLWAYSASDHTVIREVRDGSWIELRGSGLSEAAYLELLGSLRLVDERTFEASLPGSFVLADERPSEVERHLDGIRAALGPDLPLSPRVRLDVDTQEADPYALGVDVVRAVACPWLAEYTAADGTGPRAATAARVMATVRDWPVLEELEELGGEYSSAVIGYAEALDAGRMPEGFEGGLGCQP